MLSTIIFLLFNVLVNGYRNSVFVQARRVTVLYSLPTACLVELISTVRNKLSNAAALAVAAAAAAAKKRVLIVFAASAAAPKLRRRALPAVLVR